MDFEEGHGGSSLPYCWRLILIVSNAHNWSIIAAFPCPTIGLASHLDLNFDSLSNVQLTCTMFQDPPKLWGACRILYGLSMRTVSIACHGTLLIAIELRSAWHTLHELTLQPFIRSETVVEPIERIRYTHCWNDGIKSRMWSMFSK